MWNRDNFRSSSTLPVSAKAWATAPQFCGLKSFTRWDPRLRRSLLLGLDIRRTRRRGSRRPSNVAQIVCSGICREYRSYRVSDRKIAALVSRCSERPGQVPTIARLSRFYNKFRAQRDRSTSNAKRAADTKFGAAVKGSRFAHVGVLPLGEVRSACERAKRVEELPSTEGDASPGH